VRRAGAAAVSLVLGLAGCGSGEVWVGYESISPPAGIVPAGEEAERQGSNHPDAGEPIFELRPREGETIRYAVAVRNLTDREISVTDVIADEDRDGAFVPQEVLGAPVKIPAGERGQVTVEGTVHGCDYGGQMVPIAGPELAMRDADGEETTQELPLDVKIRLIVEDGC
jgi:hypothetical protein